MVPILISDGCFLRIHVEYAPYTYKTTDYKHHYMEVSLSNRSEVKMKNIILSICLLSLVGCVKSENNDQFRHNLKQGLMGFNAQMQQQRQQQLELYKTLRPRINKTTNCTTQYSGNMAYTNCN